MASLLEKAVELIRSQQYDGAEEILRSAMATERAPLVRALLGRLYLLRRRPLDALSQLEAAAEALPDSSFVHSTLGRCHVVLGNRVAAVPHLQTAQRLQRNEFAAAYRLGRVALWARNYVVAQAAFARCIDLRPGSRWAHFGRGLADFSLGAFAQAEISLREANRGAFDPEVTGYLGFALLNQGLDQEAEQLIMRALKARPQWLEARICLGHLLIRADRLEEARDWLNKILNDAPDSGWAHYCRALAEISISGDAAWAASMITAIRKIESDRETPVTLPGGLAAAWYRAGRVLLRTGDDKGAIEALYHAVRLAPTRASHRLVLASTYFKIESWKPALEHAAAVRKGAREYPQACLLRGMCLLRLGRVGQARLALEEAAEKAPLNPEAFRELGRVYMRLGRHEDAEKALAAALRIDAATPQLSGLVRELEGLLNRPIDGDAGLPDISDFPIPEEFRPRPDDPALEQRPSLVDGLRTHVRVSAALMQREMSHRYGRTSIGYLWALVQPLMYMVTLMTIFLVIQRPVPFGTTMETFLVTGIVPVVCFFMNVEAKCSGAVQGNRNLLFYRGVTPLSLLVSSALLQYLTSLVVFAIILSTLVLMRQDISISDPLKVWAGLTGISLLATMLGSLLGLLAMGLPSVKHLSSSINRVVFILSGAFFYAGELPPGAREFILLNPIFHLVEKVREGFFAGYASPHTSWSYPATFILGGLLMTLAAERTLRRFMVAQ